MRITDSILCPSFTNVMSSEANETARQMTRYLEQVETVNEEEDGNRIMSK